MILIVVWCFEFGFGVSVVGWLVLGLLLWVVALRVFMVFACLAGSGVSGVRGCGRLIAGLV